MLWNSGAQLRLVSIRLLGNERVRSAFGLHGALIVGPALPLDEPARDRLVAILPDFELTLQFRAAEGANSGVHLRFPKPGGCS